MRNYVIFDMDGVLLDSEYGAFCYLQATLKRLGVHLELDYLLSMIGRTSNYIYERLIRENQLDMTVEELREENHRFGSYYETCENLNMMKDLPRFLELLTEKGIQIAVVSATNPDGVLTTLNRLDLLKYMRFVIGGNMFHEPKPSPAGYLMGMEYLGCGPEECVIFEDSPVGIQAAKNAGARVVGFKGSVITQDTSGADLEVFSYGEAAERFLEIFEG